MSEFNAEYKFKNIELGKMRDYLWECNDIAVDELTNMHSDPIVKKLVEIEQILIDADKPSTTKKLVEQFVYRLNNDEDFNDWELIKNEAEEMLKQIIDNEG